MTSRNDYLVICRTDHPAYPGMDWHYVIAAEEKRLWTPGEYVVDRYRDGVPVDGVLA